MTTGTGSSEHDHNSMGITTTIQFGPYLTELQGRLPPPPTSSFGAAGGPSGGGGSGSGASGFGPSLTTKVVVVPKGVVDDPAVSLPTVLMKATHFQTVFTQDTLAPFRLKEGAPSSITLWRDQTQTVITTYANDVTRHMGYLRSDKIQEVVASAVPKEGLGHALVVIVIRTPQEALPAGLALARNWPLYNRKTGGGGGGSGSKGKTNAAQGGGGGGGGSRTIYVDFVLAKDPETAHGEINYRELQVVADSMRMVQRLVDMPCAELDTTNYVSEIQREVEALKTIGQSVGQQHVTMEVIAGPQLKERGFGGLWGVGKGADQGPALVVLSRRPTASVASAMDAGGKTVALVGKGIVYDTGGLSLKPTASMCGMKGDMGGSAAVLGAFKSIVTVNAAPTTTVHAVLCLAENAIGSRATRNDDILHMYSGKTVEINNTDAEGRLVLADGVAYASQHFQPDVVVDIATLTGAQLITTGKMHAGVLCNTDAVEKRVLEAGKATGELCFPLLYAPDVLRSLFDSAVADMKNSVKDRLNAQSSAAGHFIEAHLSPTYKGEYLHIDIAGPAGHKERATGFGAALLYQFVKSL